MGLCGQLLGDSAALAELEALHARGMITDRVHQTLRSELDDSQQELRRRAAELGDVDRAVEEQQIRRIRRHLTDVKKARFYELVREGILTNNVYEELNEQLDTDLSIGNDDAATQDSEHS